MGNITRKGILSLGMGAADALGMGGLVAALAGSRPTSALAGTEGSLGLRPLPSADMAEGYGEVRATLAVISDTHIGPECEEYEENLGNALADIAEGFDGVDGVVVVGDITNTGKESDYEAFAGISADAGYSYPADFTLMMGNHDQIQGGTDEALHAIDCELFSSQAGVDGCYYDRYVGSTHLIVLGPDRASTEDPVNFLLSDGQLGWLEGLLAADEAAGAVSLVFLHEPLSDTVADTQEGGWGRENSIENDAQVASVIRAHGNAMLFTGHTHSYPDVVQAEEGGTVFVGTGSVAYAYEDGEDYLTTDDSYDSYGWQVTLRDGCVELRLRDFLSHGWVDGSRVAYALQ